MGLFLGCIGGGSELPTGPRDEPNPRGGGGREPREPKAPQARFGRKDKEERCRTAVEEAKRANEAINRRLGNAISAGGLDRGHQRAIEQSLNQLKKAVEAIDKNCFDGPGGPPLIPELARDIEALRHKASEYKVPPVGWDGGRTAAETRIKAAALGGNLGSVLVRAAQWLWSLVPAF